MTSNSSACSRCSGLIEEGDRFCQECGFALQAPLRSPLLGRSFEPEADEASAVDVPSFLRQTDPARTATITRQPSKMLQEGKSPRVWFSQPMSVPEWLLIVSMAVYSATTIYFLQKDHPQWLRGLNPTRLLSMFSLPKSKTPVTALVAKEKEKKPNNEVESLFNQSKQLAEKTGAGADPSKAEKGAAAGFEPDPAGGANAEALRRSDTGRRRDGSAAGFSTSNSSPRAVRNGAFEHTTERQARIDTGTQESEQSTHLTGAGRLAVDQVMGRDRSRPATSGSGSALQSLRSVLTGENGTNKSTDKAGSITVPNGDSGLDPATASGAQPAKKLTKNDMDEMSQYSKALAKFFSRQKEKAGDAPPGEAPPIDGEPPSFDEWLKSNKADF